MFCGQHLLKMGLGSDRSRLMCKWYSGSSKFLSIILNANIHWSQKSSRWVQKWEPDLRRCFHVRHGKGCQNTKGMSCFSPFFRTLQPWSVAFPAIVHLCFASYLQTKVDNFDRLKRRSIVGLSVIYLWCSFIAVLNIFYIFIENLRICFDVSVEQRFLFFINRNVFC